jgi:hypothetical protein
MKMNDWLLILHPPFYQSGKLDTTKQNKTTKTTPHYNNKHMQQPIEITSLTTNIKSHYTKRKFQTKLGSAHIK